MYIWFTHWKVVYSLIGSPVILFKLKSISKIPVKFPYQARDWSPLQLDRKDGEKVTVKSAEEGGDDELAESTPREITLYRYNDVAIQLLVFSRSNSANGVMNCVMLWDLIVMFLDQEFIATTW